MGRKGVSKRKPKQTKQSSTPASGNNSGRSTTQDLRQAESQASPVLGGEIKPSTGSNKKNKKR
jgi:hypothetical protein